MKKLKLDNILILFLVIAVIFKYSEHLFVRLNIDEFAQKYSNSQYILGEASPQKISDSELYVYASHALLNGEDPTTINFEHPPIGKYYYGFFLKIFGNAYWGSILIFFGILVLLNKIAIKIGLKMPARVLVILLTGGLSIFQVHTRYELLDLPYLFGVLLFFFTYLSLKKDVDNKQLLLIGLSLAILAGVKYWFPFIFIFIILIAYRAVKLKSYRLLFIPALIGATLYLASYTFYFSNGHNLIDFVNFEKYRLSWFGGKTDAPKLLIFQTLFTGRYKLWWGENIFEVTQHWSLIWPTIFVLSLIGFYKALVRRKTTLLLLLGYSYFVLAVFSIGSAASDRFFIQLLPFWSLGAAYFPQIMWDKSKAQVK